METPEKNFNYREYRKNLAEDLKNIRNNDDKEGAKKILDIKRMEEEYVLARELKDSEATFKKTLDGIGYFEYNVSPSFDGLGHVRIDLFKTKDLETALDIARKKLILQNRLKDAGLSPFVSLDKDGQVNTYYFSSNNIETALKELEKRLKCEGVLAKFIIDNLDVNYGVVLQAHNYSSGNLSSFAQSVTYRLKDGNFLSFSEISKPSHSQYEYNFNIGKSGLSVDELKDRQDMNDERDSSLSNGEKGLRETLGRSFEEKDANRFRSFLKELSMSQLVSLSEKLGLDL